MNRSAPAILPLLHPGIRPLHAVRLKPAIARRAALTIMLAATPAFAVLIETEVPAAEVTPSVSSAFSPLQRPANLLTCGCKFISQQYWTVRLPPFGAVQRTLN